MKLFRKPTVTELVALFVLLAAIGTIAFVRQQTLATIHRDQQRKTALNAIHYTLQEVTKPALGAYPRKLSASQLTAMDASQLRDPDGQMIGTRTSDYRYEPTGCDGGDLCRGYTLSAALENEPDLVLKQQ